MRAQAERDRPELVRAILAGKLRLSEIDPNRVDFVMLEDEIAQTGQGAIAVRSNEHLAAAIAAFFFCVRSGNGNCAILAEGRPVKQWTIGRIWCRRIRSSIDAVSSVSGFEFLST